MRRLFAALAVITSMATGATAQNATVVELYTSQGCSSCPPADAMLKDLARRNDVIALALHVDYWDYIGWVDDLASPAYTERQRAFARAAGARTVYTPQMVIGGVDHVIGAKGMELMEHVQAHNAAPDPVAVTLNRSGNTLSINAQARGLRDNLVVQLVRYQPSVSRDIRRGENAGRVIEYANVVTSWQNIANWNTASPLALQASVSGSQPIVVIVQKGTNGPVMGAAQLR